MSFGEMFPVSAWCCRQLVSCTARRVYVSFLGTVILAAIALRIEAARFEKQASATVRALSTLQVGVSSKAEFLARMQALKPVTGPYGVPLCNADECLAMAIPNSRLSDAVFVPVARTENSALYSLLTWLGFRYWSLSVYVNFTSGRVSYFSYDLMLSHSHFDRGADVVVVEVTSQENIGKNRGSELGGDETYRMTHSGAWPDKSVGIAFTPSATKGLVNDAFDLKLHCLWSLAGCKTWSQLLPQVRG